LLIIGSRDKDFGAKRITINGVEKPEALVFAHETTYRLRVINMAPNLLAEFRLGAEKHPMTWRAIAKDGADLPARLAKKGDAVLEIASGETYDFEFRAEDAGDVPLEIQNFYTNAKLTSNIVVR
jgi:hypothetical protein